MLDKFEGVPTDYERLALPLNANDEPVTAWVYIATSPLETELFPSWDYLSHLLVGQDVLSTDYWNKLCWWATVPGDTSVMFVYGSLRPDDDSGMPWTESFRNKVVATRATLHGARLYEDTYATAVLGTSALPDEPIASLDLAIQESDTIRGYAVRPRLSKVSFEGLLRETDAIEGCPTLYQRSLSTIVLDDSGIRHEAYVYHRSDCKKDKLISSGDWLQRQR